jgi:prepilin-type N-terminal cleavage/methylation domain-containing protein
VSRRNGYTLMEILIVLAIIGLILGVAFPNFQKMQRRMALRAAAGELRSVFNLVRMRAIARGINTGVKFVMLDGAWHFATYEDGDHDGVRNDDIKKGTDPMVAKPRIVFSQSQIVTIGLPSFAFKDPDGDTVKSPVTFNQTALCSFSPIGEATPGSIYITDNDGELWCVRVYGATAKVRALRYDRTKKRWVS